MFARLWRLCLAALLLVWAAAVQADVPIPPPKARVTDLTGTLSPEQRASIERQLAELEARKGAQLAVLIVSTTEPETIEQYARRVLDDWKLGRKGVDDGALLLVAKDDRFVRIETQYGLEGVIPDAVAKRIIDEHIVPRFQQGDFAGGIQAGLARMIGLVEGETLPPPAKTRALSLASFGDVLPFLAFGVFFLGGLLRAIFGQFVGASVGGVVIAFVVWFIAGSVVAAIVAGLFVFVFLLASAGRGGMGGWGSGGYGGGWSGSSGGGWSGGGGMGGGGGASGRW
jgi:uncharacterized protein